MLGAASILQRGSEIASGGGGDAPCEGTLRRGPRGVASRAGAGRGPSQRGSSLGRAVAGLWGAAAAERLRDAADGVPIANSPMRTASGRAVRRAAAVLLDSDASPRASARGGNATARLLAGWGPASARLADGPQPAVARRAVQPGVVLPVGYLDASRGIAASGRGLLRPPGHGLVAHGGMWLSLAERAVSAPAATTVHARAAGVSPAASRRG
jgi:hypothetical protein